MEDTRRFLVANRYWSPTNSYLHITTATRNPTVERFMNFDLVTNTFVDVVYYTVSTYYLSLYKKIVKKAESSIKLFKKVAK